MKVFYPLITTALLVAGGLQYGMAQNVTSLQLAVSTKPTVAVTEGKLAVGGTRTLVTIVEPAEAESLPVTWSVSDPAIVALDAKTAGKFRGMAPGTAVVTAEVGGVEASYTVAVSQKDAKVGDFYFSNNTWESAGGIVTGKTCIGIVFYVDPTNKQSGKIVSLDEAKEMKWSPETLEQPGAVSEFDGMANLAAIKGVAGWQEKFDAEAWCTSKTDGGLQWYLPAIAELRQLFAATCGLTWVESGASEGTKEINDWTELNVTMTPSDPADDSEGKINPYPSQRAAFNKKFTNIGATAFNADGTTRYWSSTQYATDFAMMLSFEGGFPMIYPKQYFFDNVRAIAKFPLDLGTSAIESIAVGGNSSEFSVLYNPSTGIADIRAAIGITSVQVYSLAGSITAVKTNIDGASAKVDVSGFIPGTYIVIATLSDGSRHSAKIMKR
ncbi:T9SS type A sorting domain-containing protein [uncultured Muribaculum sp.]|uniref:T9SS type A sorting domain-containing protein n=1 Tax=uncultured Muribaculum sp. TaxID=1918613 RepID=UPI002600B7A3|nr:T9SS type A sorting domain-containing protein [uncultured Muribaculum sp.]